MENKREILNALSDTLKLTRAGKDIVNIDYEKTEAGEYAVVCYESGLGIATRRYDITADSGIAMIYDIAKAIM